MKSKRVLSFLIMALVYIIAIVSSVVIYSYLPVKLHFAVRLLIADVIATVIVFIFSLLFKNASVYDPYWSVQPIVITICFAINKKLSVAGILSLIIVLYWGIRLTLNWAYTFKDLNHQDWRYSMLKEKTKKLYFFVNLFGIHMFPTLVVYCCVLPIVYVLNYATKFNAFTVIGFVISLVFVTIQMIADIQMHKFRKQKTNTFIRNGLWKYSRHPNYLGEIMMWIGVAIMCLGSLTNYWYLCVGAIINTLMFLFISIPMAEKHQASRKPNFDEYKKQTRMLLPIKK